MTMSPHRLLLLQRARGIVLIAALFILALMSVLTLAFLQNERVELRLGRRHWDRAVARQAAWSGLHRLMADLATDGVGRESSRTCSFLVADTWAADSRTFADTLSLRMRQPAIDDTNRSDPLDSLADVLHTMLNSSGLRNEIHGSLIRSPILKPNGCDQRVQIGRAHV